MTYRGPSTSKGVKIFVKDTTVPDGYNAQAPITTYPDFICNIELHNDEIYASNRYEKAKEVHQSN